MQKGLLYTALTVVGFGWLALAAVFFIALNLTDAFSEPFTWWLLKGAKEERSWAFYIFNPDAPWRWAVDLIVFLPAVAALVWRESLSKK